MVLVILMCLIVGLAALAFGTMGFVTGFKLPGREWRYLLSVQLLAGLASVPGVLYYLGISDRLQPMAGMAICMGPWLLGTLIGRLSRRS